MSAAIKTPACDRMLVVKDKSQLCGEFLEWLESRYTLCIPGKKYPANHRYDLAHIDVEELLAEFFNIDLEEVEREKRALLKQLARGTE